MALPALPARGVVVNATGVAARALAADPSVPVSTHVALLENPGLDAWWRDLTSPFSVLPHGDRIAVEGAGWRTTGARRPDRAVGERLAERARELVPQLRGARLTGVRVALRPARPTVRLEAEHLRPTRTPTACWCTATGTATSV